ncbi:DUF6314 family protein [Arthrobacter sp. TMN-50]
MSKFAPHRLGSADTLLGYLRGAWSVDRTLQDLTSGLTGTFSGTAAFTPDDGGALHHGEHGTLIWAGSPPTPATRELLWRQAGGPQSAEVLFPDGRFFHALDLSTGQDSPVHPCSPDVYRGEFLLVDQDHWQYHWRVSGPEKDLTLITRLIRTASRT